MHWHRVHACKQSNEALGNYKDEPHSVVLCENAEKHKSKEDPKQRCLETHPAITANGC